VLLGYTCSQKFSYTYISGFQKKRGIAAKNPVHIYIKLDEGAASPDEATMDNIYRPRT
jgi:hypothetical protein